MQYNTAPARRTSVPPAIFSFLNLTMDQAADLLRLLGMSDAAWAGRHFA